MESPNYALYISIASFVVAVLSLSLTFWRARSNAAQVEVAIRQAFNGEKQTLLQRANLLMSIEGRINDSMRAVEEAYLAMQVAQSANDSAVLQVKVTLYESRKGTYLNQLERLAAETNKGNLDLAIIHREYRDVIRNVMKSYPEKFGPATEFREVKKLHDKFEETIDKIPSSLQAS